MQPATMIIPKVLLPIGNKLFIEYVAENVIKTGINNIFITINHKFKDMLQKYVDYMNSKHNANIKIIPVVHEQINYSPLHFMACYSENKPSFRCGNLYTIWR